MIHTTRWSPDTCKCVLEYTWDDSVPESERVHTPATVVAQCEFHVSVPIEEVFAAVVDENAHKNKVINEIAVSLPTYAKEETNQKGEKTVTPDLDKLSWLFDENRKLVVKLKEIQKVDKDILIEVLSEKFTKEVEIK